MLGIDQVAYSSHLKHINPHVRIGLPLIWLVLMIFLGQPMLYAVTFVFMVIATLWKGSVPVKLYIKALLAPAFFVLTAVLGILFVSSPGMDQVIWQFHLGKWLLYLTDASLMTAAITLERAFASVSLVYFIACHAPIWEIGLYMRRLKVPKDFVELFVLCYRFVFILLEEAGAMLEAQQLRLGYGSVERAFKDLGMLIGQLLIRTLLRARAMEEGLSLRLYDGEFHLE